MFLLFRYLDGDISRVYNHGYFRDYALATQFRQYLSALYPDDGFRLFKVSYSQFSLEYPTYIFSVNRSLVRKWQTLGLFNSEDSADMFMSCMISFFPFSKYRIFNRFENAVQASHMDTQQALF